MRNLLAAILLGAALSFGASAQTLNAKLGLWEVTSTTESSGRPPIPPEMLARLSPEQRAKMEAAIEAHQAKGPQTTTHKACYTEKDRERAFQGQDDDGQRSCKRTIVSQSARRMQVRLDCTGASMGAANGMFTVDAITPENVKGTVDMKVVRGDRTMNVKSSFSARWLGADCGEYKHN
ncbi:MAG: DUF3617 domain-containing protein [Gemmatimonadota bacterium]